MKTLGVAFVLLALSALTGCSETKPSAESEPVLITQAQANTIDPNGVGREANSGFATQPDLGTADQVSGIEEVLSEDEKAYDDSDSYTQLENKLAAVDLSKCPKGFQQAYADYILAWTEMVEVENKNQQFNQEYNSNTTVLEGLARELFLDDGIYAEIHSARAKIDDLKTQALADIRKTYSQVQHIAIAYGVDVSRYK